MNRIQDFVIIDGVLKKYEGFDVEVSIPDGVQTIETFAFNREQKENIEMLYLPKTLEVIENRAFEHCEKLKSVVIPCNVREIGKEAFNWCIVLSEVVFEGTPEIEEGAFERTKWQKEEYKKAGIKIVGRKLVSVQPDVSACIIPSIIKIIDDSAFRNSCLKSVDVPDGVEEIGNYAFMDASLERISLPNTLKTIGRGAFEGCKNLTELIIPKTVCKIGSDAFSNLPNCIITFLNETDYEDEFIISDASFGNYPACVKEVRTPYGSAAMRAAMKSGLKVTKLEGSPSRYEYMNDEFCCDGKILHEYFGQNKIVYIPEGIESVGKEAFSGTAVEEVYLPKTVKRIDSYGFGNCKNLIKVVGEGIQEIDSYAFLSCKNLRRVEFPSLTSCYDISFEHCDNLLREDVIIPEEATVIEVVIESCACGYMHKKHTPFTSVEIEEAQSSEPVVKGTGHWLLNLLNNIKKQ